MAGRQGEPSAFSAYASRFLAGGVKGRQVEQSQVRLYIPALGLLMLLCSGCRLSLDVDVIDRG
jgi:hypothetical protein